MRFTGRGPVFLHRYILTPIIARTAVRFPPAYTLALQALFGSLFGILGLTFATPTGIVAVTIIELLYVRDVLGDRALPPFPTPRPAAPKASSVRTSP